MINLRKLVLGTTVRAAHIPRYSTIPVVNRESVAEHSFFVALYTAIIATDLKWLEVKKLTAVNIAIVHDIEECLTGDFLRSFKKSNAALMKHLEIGANRCAKTIAAEIGGEGGESVYAYWAMGKELEEEGMLVKFADFLSVVAYLVREARMGNLFAVKMIETELQQYYDLFKWTQYHFLREYVHNVKPIISSPQGWNEVNVSV